MFYFKTMCSKAKNVFIDNTKLKMSMRVLNRREFLAFLKIWL